MNEIKNAPKQLKPQRNLQRQRREMAVGKGGIEMETPTPLGDFFGEEEIRQFERDHSHIFEDRTDEAMAAHRERPYLGQPHTHHGERGKTEARGLTMRDIGDCIARGFAQSLADGDEWDFDEGALIQNTICNIEIMMGIYPNVPKPKGGDAE